MQDSDRKSAIILSAIGIVPVVWLSLLIAPFVKGGLTEIVAGLMKSFEHPFQIQFCEDSLKLSSFCCRLRSGHRYLLFHTQELPTQRRTRLR